MVPTPTDRMEFRKSTPDLKVQSAAKEHSSEVRGGGRDPGVGRPGAGPGHLSRPLPTGASKTALNHSSGSCDVCPHVAAARAYLRYITKVTAVIQLLP